MKVDTSVQSTQWYVMRKKGQVHFLFHFLLVCYFCVLKSNYLYDTAQVKSAFLSQTPESHNVATSSSCHDNVLIAVNSGKILLTDEKEAFAALK